MKGRIVFPMLAVLFSSLMGCDESVTLQGAGGACKADGDCQAGLVCNVGKAICEEEFEFKDVGLPDWVTVPDVTDDSEADVDAAEEDLSPVCTDGEERNCGSNLGECTVGTEGCIGGQWTECTGQVPSDELCDGKDNDCDGEVDGAQLQEVCGTNNGACEEGIRTCEGGAWSDCKGGVQPQLELCDHMDNDCDGFADEEDAVDAAEWYLDFDEDSFGDATQPVRACYRPDGYVADNRDCDDTLGTTNPEAPELCDLIDNDCDTFVDEGVAEVTLWFADADGDNYGDPNLPIESCSQPVGYVADNTDCDDDVLSVHPQATEACDQVDNDCNGFVDEGAMLLFFEDLDHDNFGNAAVALQACSAPTGYVPDNTDCDDGASVVYPSAIELCDGLDNDCDSLVDEDIRQTFYFDFDNDNFGDANDPRTGCTAPTGTVANASDCDDTRGSVYPGATELCDNRDNDCNGLVDDGAGTLFYRDLDGDSFGNAGNSVVACTAPVGYVASPTDCNDAQAADYPAAPELCDGRDNDCNGDIDDGIDVTFYQDADRDGQGTSLSTVLACQAPPDYVANSLDCDDSTGSTYFGAPELCDGLDNNCNGVPDDNVVTTTFYPDGDSDGYGIPAGAVSDCAQPVGYVQNSLDCDDTNGAIRPGAPEVCDGVDNNCANGIDEGVKLTFYADSDSDTYGDFQVTTLACTPPAGYVANSADCDDTRFVVNPGRTETCDGLDNNCNGQTDEGVKLTFYRDADGDNYGALNTTTQACSAPSGYVSNSTDCNDGAGSVHPGATEVCNGVDENCNGQTDEGTLVTFYRDADGDTYGNPLLTSQACTAPIGYVANNTDCDDTRSTVRPGGTELCNGLDDNCINGIDEGVKLTFYRDADSDNYGNPNVSSQACTAPSGYVVNSTDCDDTRPTVHPGAGEVCNGLDDNCNGQTDEGVKLTFYRDADNDSYGTSNTSIESCSMPSGYAANSTDCDDTRSSVNPGAPELCDGIDNNCNGQTDEGCPACNPSLDRDFDGYNECNDCDDTNGAVYPSGPEFCDGIDNDCDTLIDEDFDVDLDTYSVCSSDPLLRDCDDALDSVNPGAPELCGTSGNGNGIDDNCDGYIDETCHPCDPSDPDGDNVSDCAGDCAPNSPTVYPGAPELCDGLDNDCNRYTVENCNVSDRCNIDGDSNYDNDADRCMEDLICACAVDATGTCGGNYFCTAFCNTSVTGPLGDGCASNQACMYDLLRSANVHGCGVVTSSLGTKRGGESCTKDVDCRSNSCYNFPGNKFCLDYCGSDDYCTASSTRCGFKPTSTNLDAICYPNAVLPGTAAVGATCTTNTQCDHGLCTATTRKCTEPCCKDADCPAGYNCSLAGNNIDSTYAIPPPGAPTCAVTTDCPAGMYCLSGSQVCAWILTETPPMCLADATGQGTRQAGAACTTNLQCRSNFCDATLSVCVETCCNDTACPTGLSCEYQIVESAPDRVTNSRVCVNVSTDEFFMRK